MLILVKFSARAWDFSFIIIQIDVPNMAKYRIQDHIDSPRIEAEQPPEGKYLLVMRQQPILFCDHSCVNIDEAMALVWN